MCVAGRDILNSSSWNSWLDLKWFPFFGSSIANWGPTQELLEIQSNLLPQLFLLINIESFFWFSYKSLFGNIFEEGDNYVLANTSAYLLILLIIILLEFFGFLTKVFLEIFLRRETTTSWLTPRPTCSSFSSSFYWSFLLS